MRKLKKLFGLILVCTIVFSSISFAGAANIASTSTNTPRYDYFVIENGALRPATTQEAAEHLIPIPEHINFKPASTPPPPGTWSDIWEFTDSKYLMEGNVEEFSQPVSAWSKVDSSGTGVFTVQVSKTFGREYSISLGAEAKTAISAQIGASQSISISQGVSQSLPCRKDSTARLRYIPHYKVYEGALNHRKWNYSLVSSQKIKVYQPTTYENGMYIIEYK